MKATVYDLHPGDLFSARSPFPERYLVFLDYVGNGLCVLTDEPRVIVIPKAFLDKIEIYVDGPGKDRSWVISV